MGVTLRIVAPKQRSPQNYQNNDLLQSTKGIGTAESA
jgi:hypothetical protein